MGNVATTLLHPVSVKTVDRPITPPPTLVEEFSVDEDDHAHEKAMLAMERHNRSARKRNVKRNVAGSPMANSSIVVFEFEE